MSGNLWAITSYYNPLSYRRRLANYRVFHNNLTVPLLTVELGYKGAFELKPDDADVVVQVPGVSTLWQKENLLNIGLAHLPAEARVVAWLDCDIRLSDTQWASKAEEALHKHSMVQLFSDLYDLTQTDPPEASLSGRVPSGHSIMDLIRRDHLQLRDFRPSSTIHMRQAAFGLAWAAQRQLLDEHKFYEVAVLGSGDRALLCAAFGRFEDAIATLHMNEARRRHYLRWALPFSESVGGDVGVLDGSLVHCWHGDLADRHYASRHLHFKELEFDPERDLKRNDAGIISWAAERDDLEQFARRYFESRREDGW